MFLFVLSFVGPGCTSVGIGAFTEHGPFVTNQGEALQKNQYSWNKGAEIFTTLSLLATNLTKLIFSAPLNPFFFRGKHFVPGLTSRCWILLLSQFVVL